MFLDRTYDCTQAWIGCKGRKTLHEDVCSISTYIHATFTCLQFLLRSDHAQQKHFFRSFQRPCQLFVDLGVKPGPPTASRLFHPIRKPSAKVCMAQDTRQLSAEGKEWCCKHHMCADPLEGVEFPCVVCRSPAWFWDVSADTGWGECHSLPPRCQVLKRLSLQLPAWSQGVENRLFHSWETSENDKRLGNLGFKVQDLST